MDMRLLLLGGMLALPTPATQAQEVNLALPPECALQRSDLDGQGVLACLFTTPGGEQRRITLSITTDSLGCALQDALAGDPDLLLGDTLISMLAQAAAVPPPPGQEVLLSRFDQVPATQLPPGLDACARFDFDFADTAGPMRVRSDNTGLWCAQYDPDRALLRCLKLEYHAVHPGTAARTPGFDADAARLLESLIVTW